MGGSSGAVGARREFVQALARGLSVLESFGAERPAMTLSEVATTTGLTRGTARRLLITLEELGYVRAEGRVYRPTSRVLDLGHTFLAQHRQWELARRVVGELVARTRESSSIGVLEGREILYVLRVPTDRIMSINLAVGARLPAYATSTGRVLLAALPEAELDRYLAEVERVAFTERTVVEEAPLRALLDHVRRDGYALVDQEMELGVRSLAVPLRDRGGTVVAAMTVSAHAGRVSSASLRDGVLGPLRETARAVERELFGDGGAGG